MKPSLKIAMIASECVPFAKTGGLADVVGALPKALRAMGHDVIVILPKYSAIQDSQYNLHPTLGPVGCGWEIARSGARHIRLIMAACLSISLNPTNISTAGGYITMPILMITRTTRAVSASSPGRHCSFVVTWASHPISSTLTTGRLPWPQLTSRSGIGTIPCWAAQPVC